MSNNMQPIEYKMTKKMFNAILKTRRNNEEAKLNPHNYVMNVVNNNFGLRGHVTHLIVDD